MSSESHDVAEIQGLGVRETGPWFARRVIVPPNVWVVHTRSGHADPLHIGLGISFRFNPFTDHYLVAPAAVQTIEFQSACISKEKQGIRIVALLRWQISDFAAAYPNLDIQDRHDPLGRFNEQLRQQSDAAVKDKIATMGVDEVLTDRKPIVEDLTARLREMTEAAHADDAARSGLGIKILQVQIKEAWISSERLWDALQKPFRNETDQGAEISSLNMGLEIKTRENEIAQHQIEMERDTKLAQAAAELEVQRTEEETQTRIAQLQAEQQRERDTLIAENLRLKTARDEETTRQQRESELRLQLAEEAAHNEQALAKVRLQEDAAMQSTQLAVEREVGQISELVRLAQAKYEAEQARLQRQTVLEELTAQFELLKQRLQDELDNRQQMNQIDRDNRAHTASVQREAEVNHALVELERQQAETERLRQEVRNLISEADIAARFIAALPSIAEQLPAVDELRVLQTGGTAHDALASFLMQMQALVESMGINWGRKEASPTDEG